MALPIGHNSMDAKKIAKLFNEIDAADDELKLLHSAYMVQCKNPRGKIRETMRSAKEAGLDMPAFRAMVAERRDYRRIDARRDALEPGEAAAMDDLGTALGDYASTPLGQAAVERAQKSEAALDDLAS